MRILSLDLSTSTGWAILENSEPVCYNIIQVSPEQFDGSYPYNYIHCATEIGKRVEEIHKSYHPDYIVIEETNKPSRFTSRYSQKLLEFIHFSVVCSLLPAKVEYLSTSQWRKLCGLTMSQGQKTHNQEILEKKQKHIDDQTERFKSDLILQNKQKIELAVGKGRTLILKQIEEEARLLAKQSAGKLRLGKVTNKHLAIEKVKEIYGISLQMKENDIADALLIAWGYYRLKQQENYHGNK